MYEEKYVRRGEIYSIRMDSGYGSEQGTTRPGLIISNDVGNNTSPTVVVAYMTTRDHNIGIHYGPTKATGRPSFIQCEQLATVDKRRLLYLMGQLTRDEMKQVEDRLDEALDMGYIDDTALKEKEAECAALKVQKDNLEAEVFRLKKQIEAHDDELIAKDVEIAVRQRMYEKAIGIIAAIKAEPDLPERPMPPVKLHKQPKENPPKPKSEPKLADINSAEFSVLRGVGLPNNLVLTVINGRPYKSVEDLKNLPGMTRKLYDLIVGRICCLVEEPVIEEPKTEEPTQKVNVNTATAEEIVERTGISRKTADMIVSYRNKNGRIEKVEDLLSINRFGNGCYKKYGPMLEV